MKIAWVHGQLLLEVHPPVDAEGQSGDAGPPPSQIEPDLKALSKMIQKTGVDKPAPIQWPRARATLKNATGRPTLVGAAASDRVEAARNASPDLAQAAND